MKKCKGCGEILQSRDPNSVGYVLNDAQEYCQRCFRLIHYGDINKLTKEKIDNKEIIKTYDSFKDDVFVLIVDGFDALVLDIDDLLDYFKTYKLILIINKIDLLPRHVKNDKLEDLYANILNKCNNSNFINCLLTYKDDESFNDLFLETISKLNNKRFIFVGRANAGKSTIINKLLQDNVLTTSTYPGTTVKVNKIQIGKYTFIDTPGLKDDTSFVNYIDNKKLKYLCPNKCIKPKTYQLYEEQSYIVEGLVRIDIIPVKHSSISFIINNDLQPHRTKTNNAQNYLDKHQGDFKLKLLPLKENIIQNNNYVSLFLKGFGYIKIKGKSLIKLYVNDKIKVYRCEVNI